MTESIVLIFLFQDEVEIQQPDESNPYEEVYKDSSTFLKVEKSFTAFYVLVISRFWCVQSRNDLSRKIISTYKHSYIPVDFNFRIKLSFCFCVV